MLGIFGGKLDPGSWVVDCLFELGQFFVFYFKFFFFFCVSKNYWAMY